MAQLGGDDDWLGYFRVPCTITEDTPNLVLKMGDATRKAEWVITPQEYTLPVSKEVVNVLMATNSHPIPFQHPWYTSECVSLLQSHPWYPAWTSR